MVYGVGREDQVKYHSYSLTNEIQSSMQESTTNSKSLGQSEEPMRLHGFYSVGPSGERGFGG
jgi:hypothetical protein